MDGFHRTQAELAADPDPDFSFRRRGAPFTFNPDALLSLVRRIRTTPSSTAPSFSHAKKDPVEGDVKIEPHHRIVLVEGTFLMLDEAPWSSIAQEVDERWFYDVPEEVALQRVVQRHIAAGLAADRQAAEAKALANDVLNAQLVLSKLITPDKTLYETAAAEPLLAKWGDATVVRVFGADLSHPTDGPFPVAGPKLPDSVIDMFNMKGRVTAITGGGSGIGYAVAEAIAEVGGNVALIGRRDQSENADKLAKKFGIQCKAYSCDVSAGYEAVEKTINQIGADFGRIDVFIANGVPGSIDENYDVKSWEFTQNVNLNATFYCAKAVCPWFKKAAESGVKASFIATTSISAHIVNVPYDQPAYNSSKAGTLHLCRSLARDWRNFARCNTVSPGFFDTVMGPSDAEVAQVVYRLSVFGRVGDVKELKAAYLYLASQASTYTTGSDILVDGGYTLT
ncbi:hypothetical protein Rhopal_007819-T1 [Rhodotorula paludigena]|uniref:Uncharacterized protein n=1 Tax=Rhodotorula paludigena TaxID=86838 RepID=A0AAV5GWY5_9BASI|nr:hypothetical protein Rhopal_007819-T1 [Rhodotorula paludigena]